MNLLNNGEPTTMEKSEQKTKLREIWEIWEKWWGEFLTPHREQKDPETSSTISMGYNIMETPTYTKEK